uniref:Uncharacterized protein n=1 Tax=Rhizophora mucronata TaxID=61149 RepID=A0A2P2NQX1_RHIMU
MPWKANAQGEFKWHSLFIVSLVLSPPQFYLKNNVSAG